MNDYNSQYSGAKIEELLGQIPNLAKADLSNAMTVNLNQNGYAKFNNGMLIQWGKEEDIQLIILTIFQCPFWILIIHFQFVLNTKIYQNQLFYRLM